LFRERAALVEAKRFAGLGVDLDDRFNGGGPQLGLHHLVGTRIIGTRPNSPAERAELQINDVVVKFNDITIENDAHLRTLVKLTEIGKRIELLIYRDGQPIRKTVEIGNLSEFPRD
jgi:serine protease Do